LIEASSTLEQYVLKGKERADIRASTNQLASLTKQVSVASRERLPAINLSGNYYPYQDPDSAQDWDISVSLQVPLFDAGRISSRVSQQEALRRQGELNLQQLYRTAERDIRSSYALLLASRAREKSLATLVADAEKSYESQRADYKLGIVTNIDVLQAIRQVEDAKRRLLAAGVESHINSIKLAVASGDLSL
jgi:outer membrane protein TolC